MVSLYKQVNITCSIVTVLLLEYNTTLYINQYYQIL